MKNKWQVYTFNDRYRIGYKRWSLFPSSSNMVWIADLLGDPWETKNKERVYRALNEANNPEEEKWLPNKG